MKAICVANQKGGVAKTTTTVNVASIFAARGRRVLLVDADPQGNATMHVGLNPEEYSGLSDVLVSDGTNPKAPITSVIEKTAFGFDIVPPPLVDIELRLSMVLARREMLLHQALHEVRNAYDVVVIDSPPNLGLLQLNALLSCDAVLIPFQAELFGSRSLKVFMNTLKQLQDDGAQVPMVAGMIATRLKSQAPMLNRAIIDAVREMFGDVVLPIAIREAVAVAEASSAGKPLPNYAPTSTATADYQALVDHLEKKMQFARAAEGK